MAAISDEMVRLYKEHFGRGPTKVRTNWAGPDTLISVLEDSLTASERSLIRLGQDQELRNIRMLFQYAAEPDFRRIVELATGRTVRSFVSGIDTATDVSVEVFVLEPAEPEATGKQKEDSAPESTSLTRRRLSSAPRRDKKFEESPPTQ